MNLQGFLDFMLDFTIYPTLVQRNLLEKLFNFLINVLKRSEGEFDPCRLVLHDLQDPLVSGPNEMDSHMFIEAIAMIAIIHIDVQNLHKFHNNQLEESRNDYVVKILTLCERMAVSLETHNFSFRTKTQTQEDFLGTLKQQYAWFWEEDN